LSDIWAAEAWNCGGKDGCRSLGGWHKRTYWCCEKGYTVDEYSDGDHFECDVSDLPPQEEIDESWRAYARWVVDNGKDPLGEYIILVSRKASERWHFKFSDGLRGPVLHDAKRREKHVQFRHLPEHVREYLRLDGRGRLEDFDSWKAFAEAVPGVEPLRWFSVMIEWDKPRSPILIRRELRQAARRHLRQAKKELANAAA